MVNIEEAYEIEELGNIQMRAKKGVAMGGHYSELLLRLRPLLSTTFSVTYDLKELRMRLQLYSARRTNLLPLKSARGSSIPFTARVAIGSYGWPQQAAEKSSVQKRLVGLLRKQMGGHFRRNGWSLFRTIASRFWA